MGLVYNGTEINRVVYNGTEVDKVVYNGVGIFNNETTLHYQQNYYFGVSNYLQIYVEQAPVQVYVNGSLKKTITSTGSQEVDLGFSESNDATILIKGGIVNNNAPHIIRIKGVRDFYINGIGDNYRIGSVGVYTYITSVTYGDNFSGSKWPS